LVKLPDFLLSFLESLRSLPFETGCFSVVALLARVTTALVPGNKLEVGLDVDEVVVVLNVVDVL